MTTTPTIFALVPAAGQGTRLGEAVPKQYLPLAGRPMLAHALEALARVDAIARVVAILSPEDERWTSTEGLALPGKVEAWRVGGRSRGESVANALAQLAGKASDDDWVLVHDAARPCLTPALVAHFLAAIGDDPVGGLLAVPVADTLKREGEGGRVAATVPRDGLWRAQTPQMFRFSLLRDGLAAFPGATD